MKKHLKKAVLLLIVLAVASFLVPQGKDVQAATPSVTPTPTAAPVTLKPDIANPINNGLYWINSGSTYRSGATLQFYATGAGYGPEEPQDLNPINGSTRYIPTSWSVSAKKSVDSKTTKKVKGSWKKYNESTTGYTNNGQYVIGEYRFKSSFVLKTSSAASIPYVLTVKYKRQIFNGKSWKNNGGTAVKSVSFYIKNTDAPYNSEFSIANNQKIRVGDKVDLKVYGVFSKVTFKSSNQKVATIGKNSGRIKALRVGETTITATAPAFGQYNAFAKSIKIKVIPKKKK